MTASVVTAERVRLPASYHAWVGAALVSQLGSAAMYFALGWAATEYGGSSAGLVTFLVVLPRTVLLLIGGVLGDRVGARRIMITCDAMMLILAGGLAIVTGIDGTSLALLLAAAFVVGVNDAFYLPSSGSMPRRLVDQPQLARAVALRQSGSQLVLIIGGPLGGILVTLSGFSAAAWVNTASFAGVLVVLILIRPRFTPPEQATRRHVLREAADGVRIAWTTPGLGVVLVMVTASAGFILPVGSLLIPLLARSHAFGAGAAGVLVGGYGVGTVLVTLLIARIGTHRRPGLLACCGLLVTATGQVALGLAPSVAVAAVGAFVTGVGSGVFVTHLTPVLLGAAPETHLARTQALFSIVQSMALLVTSNVLGLTAKRAGPGMTLLLCAIVLAICAVAGFASRRVRELA